MANHPRRTDFAAAGQPPAEPSRVDHHRAFVLEVPYPGCLAISGARVRNLRHWSTVRHSSHSQPPSEFAAAHTAISGPNGRYGPEELEGDAECPGRLPCPDPD